MAKNSVYHFELERLLNTIFFKKKQKASEKGISITVVDDMAASITIIADHDKWKLLLETVIDNAIDYSGASRISFTTRQILRTEKEVLLEFLLKDEGQKTER